MEQTRAANSASLPATPADGWDSTMPRVLPLLACPADGSALSWNSYERTFISSNGRRYGFLDGIASFFVPNDGQEVQGDVTEIVKAFYERTPFPNYNDIDDRGALKQKAAASAFAKLLDEQLPESVKVFEAGCGTGQLSNFLGMRPGRVCIGGDMCLNSLKLGNGFRDRFSINNAHFLQMNLFRPPLCDDAFDLVISNGVLHHTSNPEGGYRAILRKVRPGGFILIGLYNYFGRLHTLWRRRLIETFGKGVTV